MVLVNINSVDPPNGTIISLERNLLEIHYEIPISLSDRNISIYQFNGTDYFMRQTTSGRSSEFCSVDSDHKVVSLNVLPSTFNTQNSEYHVYIYSNFVKSNDSNEPMFGLFDTWILRTGIY